MVIGVNKEGTLSDIEVDYQNTDNKYTWAKLQSLDPTGKESKRLQDLAIKYSFLAYSIDYNIVLKTRSFALDKSHPSLKIMFFPLRRQFFHRAESKLDDLIFKQLKTLAREEIDTVIKQPLFKFENALNFPRDLLKDLAPPTGMAVEDDGNGGVLADRSGANGGKAIEEEKEEEDIIGKGHSLPTLGGQEIWKRRTPAQTPYPRRNRRC
jgi:hypothetical protein